MAKQLNQAKVKSTKKKMAKAIKTEDQELIKHNPKWLESTQFGKKKPKTKAF